MKVMIRHEQGIALLGAMMLLLILGILSGMLLNLAGQESLTAAAGFESAIGQHLADAAGELVVAALNNPHGAPGPLTFALSKSSTTSAGAPSFFDANGRSQFVGSSAQPDLVFNASDPAHDRLLNDPNTGLFRGMRDFGTIDELKVYAASRSGLLCTVDATVRTTPAPSSRQSVSLQLSALEVPALRSAIQVGQSLGTLQSGRESPVNVHWGTLKVHGNAVFRQAEDVPILSTLAPVTGHGYEEMRPREDRWMEAWIGGTAQVTQPVTAQGQAPNWPLNLHVQQAPIPGVHLDEWSYEKLKKAAKQFGRYFASDRAGLLYPQGIVQAGRGVTPDEALRSEAVGDQQGLIFIDTVDQQAPRPDNMATITIRTSYFEGVVVVQGHVRLSPNDGRSLAVFSPPTEPESLASRAPVQLSRVNINGVLYASGDIVVAGEVRMFGAAFAAGAISQADTGGTLEVWYNHDIGQGLYEGLPVVYRAPGTWMAKY